MPIIFFDDGQLNPCCAASGVAAAAAPAAAILVKVRRSMLILLKQSFEDNDFMVEDGRNLDRCFTLSHRDRARTARYQQTRGLRGSGARHGERGFHWTYGYQFINRSSPGSGVRQVHQMQDQTVALAV